MKEYYTYAYLRKDKTPYYIGKGSGERAWKHGKQERTQSPKDHSRILILKQFDDEAEAFKHEIYMIAVLGRKDLGTGILQNRTDGGEGVVGNRFKQSSAFCEKQSKRLKGVPKSEEHKIKISEAHKGKTMSAEARLAMSRGKKGKPWSQARRDAQSPTWSKKRREAQENRKKK